MEHGETALYGENRKIKSYTWLHTGDLFVLLHGPNRGASLYLEKRTYNDDLSVTYELATRYKRGRNLRLRVPENRMSIRFLRIATGERKLPKERFMEWTFGLSTPSRAR